MKSVAPILVLILLLSAVPLFGADEPAEEGTIFTLWPLMDYRSSPKEGFSNLSLLGPLFKYQERRDGTTLAVRPFLFREEDTPHGSAKSDYLYPLLFSETGPDADRIQALRGLFQISTYRTSGPAGGEESSQFFPFYLKGSSPKYGPYLWIFPFYGDAYERFWRDEYHFVMFPLYGRTVNKGTTTRNYLYPFFATIEGERESGFQLWPLYGQSQKEGVYRKRFVLWPVFFSEQLNLDTENPTARVMALPFYAATDSPQVTSRHVLWPFFGYTDNRKSGISETDWFWPLFVTGRGGGVEVNRFLPFYADERSPGKRKQWLLWPLFRRDRVETETFEQERHRLVFFLYNDFQERWPRAGRSRRRIALWPLFLYRKDERGISSLSVPAPVEPVLDREGIEKSWAPFWRLYQQRWNDAGESAVSFLWNLYWHEVRDDGLACELFPLVSYEGKGAASDLKLLKGLVRYRRGTDGTRLTFFWLPFGLSWGGAATEQGDGGSSGRLH